MKFLEGLTEEELNCFNRHFTRCEFDDECSACDNPKNGSYATGYDNYTGEVDDYFCGKCAVESIPERLNYDKHEWDGLEDFMEKYITKPQK